LIRNFLFAYINFFRTFAAEICAKAIIDKLYIYDYTDGYLVIENTLSRLNVEKLTDFVQKECFGTLFALIVCVCQKKAVNL